MGSFHKACLIPIDDFLKTVDRNIDFPVDVFYLKTEVRLDADLRPSYIRSLEQDNGEIRLPITASDSEKLFLRTSVVFATYDQDANGNAIFSRNLSLLPKPDEIGFIGARETELVSENLLLSSKFVNTKYGQDILFTLPREYSGAFYDTTSSDLKVQVFDAIPKENLESAVR